MTSHELLVDVDRLPWSETTLSSLVVGTDGRHGSIGALRVARRLADRDGLPVRLVAVLDVLPPAGSGTERLPSHSEAAQVVGLRRQIDRQLSELDAPSSRWDVAVSVGRPDIVLGDTSRRQGAALLLVGLGGHGVLARMLGTSTALGAARHTPVPVLAVHEGVTQLPHCAVLGTDFGQASIAAGRAALRCLGTSGSLHVVHIRGLASQIGAGALSADVAYEEELADRLAQVVEALQPGPGIRVVRHILTGHPARRLSELAEREGADLIAVGTHGHGRLGSFAIGTMASRVASFVGQASVLIASDGQRGVEVPDSCSRMRTLRSTIPQDWPDLLTAFTRRNAERRTSLEVDDPMIGAQAAEYGGRLRGIAYDPRDRRVEIMLGDLTGTRHFTHTLSEPREIDIVSTVEGRDLALGIRDGMSTTVLTLLDPAEQSRATAHFAAGATLNHGGGDQ